MQEPIDELLEWLHTFDDLQFTCTHRNVIEKIWQIKSKPKQLAIDSVSVSLFDEALKLMRDLAEHQNGAPLIRHEEEYNKTMTEVWDFLEAN